MMICTRILTLLAGWSLLSAAAFGVVTVDPMFSDHMVLQRGMSVPVWGTADPGEQVTVTFRDQTQKTRANAKGQWMLKLDALTLGDPAELTVSGTPATVFTDVLVGEVWVGSGQSNMAGTTGGYAKNDPVLAEWLEGGPYPQLRLYNKGWQIADTPVITKFSALHFSFGLSLQRALQVPVGLMVGAVGGTPSGRWLSPEMVAAVPALTETIQANEAADKAAYTAALAKWEKAVKKAKAEGKKAPRKPRGPIAVGDLYAQRIEPLVPYGIRGVLWDQGEGRTRLPGVAQYDAMSALITGWRRVWNQGDFPFLHVQKPSGGGCAWDPDNPVNRKALALAPLPDQHTTDPRQLDYPLNHIRMATLKNAPLVTAVDLEPGIHPSTKSGYGRRACRVALGEVYDRDVATCGPVYRSHTVEGNAIRIRFDHVGQGLAFRHGDALQGFEIAASDGHWAWARAVIDGDTVVVSSDKVPSPTRVQYAFNQKPSYANLFNKDGLPALMFSTSGK